MAHGENQFLYLTTWGWKSGRPHEIEIWYVELEGKHYAVSEGGLKSHWIQNSMKNPKVTYRVADRPIAGTARILNREKEPRLAKEVTALMKAKYGWGDGLILELAPSG